MFREALDTLPVAIILSLVVSFGFRTSRDPVIFNNEMPMTLDSISDKQNALLQGRTVPNTNSVCEEQVKDDLTVNQNENRAERKNELFIDRRLENRDPSVPFFTSADIPRMPREIKASDRTIESRFDSTNRYKSAGSDSKISINQSDIEQLVKIAGIGRMKAKMILDNKADGGYRSLKELDDLPGFGKATIEMIKLNAYLD